MEISLKCVGKYAKLFMKGKFVIEEVSKFEEECAKIHNVEIIIIDFNEVVYLDSSAIGALVKLMNASKNNGIEIYLYNMDTNIQHIFKLAFLDRFFNITDVETLKNTFPDFSSNL